jgi:hypothetical protein
MGCVLVGEEMSASVDALRGEYGVEPTFRVLEIAPSTYDEVKRR